MRPHQQDFFFGGRIFARKNKKTKKTKNKKFECNSHKGFFSFKTMPKSPDFNSKNSEIALGIYYTMEHVVTIYIS